MSVAKYLNFFTQGPISRDVLVSVFAVLTKNKVALGDTDGEKISEWVETLLKDENSSLTVYFPLKPDGIAVDFSVHQNMDSLNGLSGISFRSDLFHHLYLSKKHASHNISFFIKLITDLYEVIHPVYGYFDTEDLPGMANGINCKTFAIQELNLITIFDPDFVKKIGRKKINEFNPFTIHPLSDGGLLIIREKLD